MRIVIFCHSLISDWNHGNAHFLRGITSELLSRGHHVAVYEPRDAWSMTSLLAAHGEGAIAAFERAFSGLRSTRYDFQALDLDAELGDADLVLVHEWTDPALVRKIGEHRRSTSRYRLLFHDTHHRSMSDERFAPARKLRDYDGVLAFGEVIRQRYLDRGWTQRAWTWHEAADVRLFRPIDAEHEGDLVWIGNWGDEERSRELHEFLLAPVRQLGLVAHAHGVRYPAEEAQAFADAAIELRGWLPNYEVPNAFARHMVTVHIPRRPYAQALPGIPTIRVFEALACGIPLVCAPWSDTESLFSAGDDYLVARNGAEMQRHLRDVLHDDDLSRELRRRGRSAILARHTCAHRIDELMDIADDLGLPSQ